MARSMISAWLRNISALFSSSINRRILMAAITVGGFTLLVKTLSLFKELVSAYKFGTSRDLDALLIAWALPTFLINVFGGSLQAALVPLYIDISHKRGRKAGVALISSLSVIYLAVLILICICLLVSSPWIIKLIGSGFSAKEFILCNKLLYVLLPTIVFTGMARLYGGVLIAEGKFAVTTATMLTTPVFSVIAMLWLTSSIGIFSLATGILVGAFLELSILMWFLFYLNIPMSIRWRGPSPELYQIGHQYFPVIAGSVLMAGTILTDQAMAGKLPSGAVSSLNYANKIPALIMNLTSGAIGTAVLPYFSKMVASSDWNGIRHTFRAYIKLIVIITVPVTLFLILLSKYIIHYLFQRGAFTSADTNLVAWVQICLLIQVPFYTLGILAVRLISSLQANRLLMWGSMISLLLNAVLDYLFMQYMGVAGIALATSFVYIVSFYYLYVMVTRTLHKHSQV